MGWRVCHERRATNRRRRAAGASHSAIDHSILHAVARHQGNMRLSALRARAVIVNRWATWRLPCPKRGSQGEDDLVRTQGRGRDIPRYCRLGTESDARHYPGVQRCLPKWPGRYFDGGVSDIPETYIIDRQGRLVARFVGPITVEQLTQTVRSISS